MRENTLKSSLEQPELDLETRKKEPIKIHRTKEAILAEIKKLDEKREEKEAEDKMLCPWGKKH